MSMEVFWEDYTSTERDLFQKSCRRLLKQTFIVRDKDEDNKKAYYFISKKPEPFSQYFGYIGFDIVVDRENGVIMLRNCADMGEHGKIQANRMLLKKAESIVLCCLWTMYADRVRSGSLSQNIQISITELRFELEKYGPHFENHERFPKRTNTEFVHVVSRNEAYMRVWERGAGETLACGTGACAVAVACVLNDLTDTEITVHLLGGDLDIRWDQQENCVYMTGTATIVFDGDLK